MIVGVMLFISNKTVISQESELSKNSLISMYVQDIHEEYQINDSKEFPRKGYNLNLERSKCSNGGILSQDPETLTINMTSENSERCTLYFDMTIYRVTIMVDDLVILRGNFQQGETLSSILSDISDPSKEGYVFEGWTIDGVLVDLDKELTGDVTITPRWKPIDPAEPEIPIDPDFE